MLMIYFGHRVAELDSSQKFGPDTGNVASPGQLDTFLHERRSWTAVTLAELESRGMELVETDDPYYLLTFDDGYLDNLTTLVPILEDHNVPAAIFITTAFADGEIEPYEYDLARLIRSRTSLKLPRGRVVDLQDPHRKKESFETLRMKWKAYHPDRRLSVIRRTQLLNDYQPADTLERLMLTWDEISQLNEHPLIAIGAHGHAHSVLTSRSPRHVVDELTTCRDALEVHLGRSVDYLSYPYGSNNAIVRMLAGYVGFKLAFSTDERPVEHKDLRRSLALPRFDLNRLLGDSNTQ